jgi:two-component system OmpR family response regulator
MQTVLIAPPSPDDLDFTKAFDGSAKASLPLEARSEKEQQEVIVGAAELHRVGYYVNIAQRAKKVAPLTPGNKYSVLCIDDDTALLGILAKKLRLDGYAVRTASDRHEIVAELQKPLPPHLILLDVGLPGLSGFDVLLKLRQHPRLGSIPVIMLTGHASPQDVLHGMVSGADGYVSKPFQFDALTSAIEMVLGIHNVHSN